MKRYLKRIFLLTVIILSAAVTLQTGILAADEVILDACDKSGWSGDRNASVNRTDDPPEGTGFVTWSVPRSGDQFIMSRNFSPAIDASDCNMLVFEFYVSDAGTLTSASTFELELTSSGTCDVDESSWNLVGWDFVDGWNHVELPISVTSQGCDLSKINYMRLFALGLKPDETLVIGIDNIRLIVAEDSEIVNTDDPDDCVIGSDDASSALPVLRPVTVKEPAVTPVTPADKNSGLKNTLMIVCFAAAGVSLAAFVVLLLMKKGGMAKLISVILTVLFVIGGVVCLLLPSSAKTAEKNPVASFLTTDQTGHPEVSASDADVEKLLSSDPSFNMTAEYEIRFKGGLPDETALSDTPHVYFHETPAASGMEYKFGVPDAVRFITITERDSYIFEFDRKNELANVLFLSLSDDKVKELDGGDILLNLIVYVSRDSSLTVSYTAKDGTEATAVGNTNVNDRWTLVSIRLTAPQFKGAFDGYDFRITMSRSDIVRVNTAYITAAGAAQPDTATGLIAGPDAADEYIWADVNVLAFGAAGDGSRDDTEAFQGAIDEVAKKGAGTVYVPAGYYCLTGSLRLPVGVGLVGARAADGTPAAVLCIYGGKGETDGHSSAIVMSYQSAVKNIAFWYPEQTFVNGAPIPYPATITQDGSEGLTIENVTFINAYAGINFGLNGNNSLQYVRDVRGTCLDYCYYNDDSFDIGKLENADFSPDYWLASGLPGTPNQALLCTYMLRNSTGLILERIDWTYLADITITGYNTGVLLRGSEGGLPNGHMYNMQILDCYQCIRSEGLNWMAISGSVFRAAGNSGACAVYVGEGCTGNITFNTCLLTTSGTNAVYSRGTSKLSFGDCSLTSVNGTTLVNFGGNIRMVNSTITGDPTGQDNGLLLTDATAPKLPTSIDYGKTVVTKPKSTVSVDMGADPYKITSGANVTTQLQQAIDSLKETGGTVYIPAGSYTLSASIHVWEGIEIRGAVSWAQNTNRTQFLTSFGKDDPDGEALINLEAGAGLRGISVIYNTQDTKNLSSYSFTVRGNGADIYLVDVCLPTSYNGVDFATNRCDRHYVEFLWGVPLNIGITVGAASEDGIIRDCHYTTNSWAVTANSDYWGDVHAMVMGQGRPFVIGESSHEILYHNFTYGGYQGLSVNDGAKDVFVLSHGVDSGNISSYFSGNCTATLIDAELVTLGENDRHYVVTAPDFTGNIAFINLACWGNSVNALELDGDGMTSVYGMMMFTPGKPMCNLLGGSASFIGIIKEAFTTDFAASSDAKSLHLCGNIYGSGLRLAPDFPTAILSGSDAELLK